MNGKCSGGIIALAEGSLFINDCENHGIVVGTEAGEFVGRPYRNSSNVSHTEITIINSRANSYGGKALIGSTAGNKQLNITIKNCEVDYRNASTNSKFAIIETIYRSTKFKVENLRVFANSDAIYLFSSIYSKLDVEIEFKDILIKNDYDIKGTKSKLSYSSSNYDCMSYDGIVFQEKSGGFYYGSNFLNYYISWRTGRLGLLPLDGIGFYQGKVNEEVLQSKGFTKKEV